MCDDRMDACRATEIAASKRLTVVRVEQAASAPTATAALAEAAAEHA